MVENNCSVFCLLVPTRVFNLKTRYGELSLYGIENDWEYTSLFVDVHECREVTYKPIMFINCTYQ